MAKGKKEDPNKVAQRKSERVAFVKAHPELKPEVARKRYYVQTRAAELEAAGKPVDRAALRQKFETGGVTREGFYTPADINRIAARNASLADSKATTTTPTTTTTGKTVTPSTSVVPQKTTPIVTSTTSTTVPSTVTTTPNPISGTMPRIADRVNQTAANARAMSPDVAEAKANAPKPPAPKKPLYNTKPGTDVPTNPFLRGFYEIGKFTVGGIESAKASYINPVLNTANEFKASLADFKANPSWQTAWSGGSKSKEAEANPRYRRSSATEDVMNAAIALPHGTGRAIAGAGARGLERIGATGASQWIEAFLKVTAKNPAIAALPAVEKPALPAAGYTGKQGARRLAEEARIAALAEERAASRGWGAGESPMPDLAAADIPKSRMQVAAERKAARDAEVAARNAERAAEGIGSLHDVKQADLQKMVDDMGLNIETGPTMYEDPFIAGSEPTPAAETSKPTKGKGKGKGKTKVEVKVADTPVDNFEFDASTMEMGSTERATGDAYLYNPADDIAAENLASIKAKQEPVVASEPAVTETKSKGKGKGKGKTKVEIKTAEAPVAVDQMINDQGGAVEWPFEYGPTQPREMADTAPAVTETKTKGKGKGKTQVEIKTAAEPTPTTVKKKPETKAPRHTVGDMKVVYPEGTRPARSRIASKIEVKGKQGTIPGQTPMRQAFSSSMPVEGEIPQILSLAEQKTASTRRVVKISGIDVVVEGSGTIADPTRVVGRPVKGESMLELFSPREAPTGTPRRIPEPPAEKMSQPVEIPSGNRVIQVEPYQPPPGKPLRITREEARRVRLQRQVTRTELAKDPFGTGMPRQIRSSMSNLPETGGGLTERQIRALGGRERIDNYWKALETDKDFGMSEAVKNRDSEALNRMSRWVTKKRLESRALNPDSPTGALDAVAETLSQARFGRSIRARIEFEQTGGQIRYQDMVRNPRASTAASTAESRALEAEGKAISQKNDIAQKSARSGSKSGPTPETVRKALSELMPIIERLEPKVKAGTATIGQQRELLAAYTSMSRRMMTESKQSWYEKVKWLEGIMGKK